ncbi:MAG TPA: guanitoxin biosynthesis heme-dependent pre-guanitoxin N-hydroxylase GntA [Flavobacterium sp.]|jgi:hypothetical protein
MKNPTLTNDWFTFIENREFPCVAAKAALAKEQQHVYTAGHLGCPRDDAKILQHIYDFVDNYRNSDTLFHSCIILFEQPTVITENSFATLFWQRLQALADLDAQHFSYDHRVSDLPESENFSFSLKGEAFFIVGLHPASSRAARRFQTPAIVFNPHAQFEQLRDQNQYDKMKKIIRKRDIALEGSINPMLEDFGTASEVYQYTGQQLDQTWKCPLHIHHGENAHHKSA